MWTEFREKKISQHWIQTIIQCTKRAKNMLINNSKTIINDKNVRIVSMLYWILKYVEFF
jgi:hypothetical protein